MERTPDVPIDDLLAHAAWARSLARELVADASAADDLVQEAWLAALKRPPAATSSPRSWLARVLQNRARNRWRASERRDRNEEIGARSEATPGADEIVQELELQRALVDALERLDEPLRRTVVRRYLHGLASAEIAREERVPESTVRNRLKRALDELRERLDARYGDRKTWIVAFAPLAGAPKGIELAPRGEPRTSTGGASTLGGGFVMGLASKLGVLGLVVAGGTWWWTRDGARTEGAHEPGATTIAAKESDAGAPNDVTNDSVAPARTTAASAASEVAGAKPLAASDALPATIVARIVDGAGKPIAGAELVVVDRSQLGEIDREDAPRATSDADGRIVLEARRVDRSRRRGAAAGSRKWTLELEATAKGRTVVPESVDLADGERTDLGAITLLDAGTIRGRVVTSDGSAVPANQAIEVVGSEMTLEEQASGRRAYRAQDWRTGRRAKLDAHGAFEITAVPVGTCRVAMTNHLPCWILPFSAPLRVEAGAVVECAELVLRPDPFTIAGVVREADGTPVKDAELEYCAFGASADESIGTLTNDEGRFAISLGTPGTFDLFLRCDDTSCKDGSARAVRTGTTDVEIVVQPERWIDLVVRDERGELIASYTVGVARSATSTSYSSSSTARPEGKARVPVGSRPFWLHVSALGREELVLGPFERAHAPEKLDVVLRPVAPITVRVIADGAPAAGARVWLVRLEDDATKKLGNGLPLRARAREHHASIVVGADGIARITERERGRYAIVARLDGLADGETELVDFDPTALEHEVVVELLRGGALEGRVLAKEGSAASGTLVGISRGCEGDERIVRVGADGAYRFEHLTAGTWWIRRSERDFVTDGSFTVREKRGEDPTLAHFEVAEGSTTRFDLDLREADVGLSGTLVLANAPARAWTARLVALGPDREHDDDEARDGSVSLDPTGKFELLPRRLGVHQLVLVDSGDGERDQRVESVVVLARGENAWELAVDTGAIEGAAPPRALVAHAWTGATGTRVVTRCLVDANGVFALHGVPIGAGTIEIQALEGDSAAEGSAARERATRKVDVAPGRATRVDLR